MFQFPILPPSSAQCDLSYYRQLKNAIVASPARKRLVPLATLQLVLSTLANPALPPHQESSLVECAVILHVLSKLAPLDAQLLALRAPDVLTRLLLSSPARLQNACAKALCTLLPRWCDEYPQQVLASCLLSQIPWMLSPSRGRDVHRLGARLTAWCLTSPPPQSSHFPRDLASLADCLAKLLASSTPVDPDVARALALLVTAQPATLTPYSNRFLQAVLIQRVPCDHVCVVFASWIAIDQIPFGPGACVGEVARLLLARSERHTGKFYSAAMHSCTGLISPNSSPEVVEHCVLVLAAMAARWPLAGQFAQAAVLPLLFNSGFLLEAGFSRPVLALLVALTFQNPAACALVCARLFDHAAPFRQALRSLAHCDGALALLSSLARFSRGSWALQFRHLGFVEDVVSLAMPQRHGPDPLAPWRDLPGLILARMAARSEQVRQEIVCVHPALLEALAATSDLARGEWALLVNLARSADVHLKLRLVVALAPLSRLVTSAQGLQVLRNLSAGGAAHVRLIDSCLSHLHAAPDSAALVEVLANVSAGSLTHKHYVLQEGPLLQILLRHLLDPDPLARLAATRGVYNLKLAGATSGLSEAIVHLLAVSDESDLVKNTAQHLLDHSDDDNDDD